MAIRQLPDPRPALVSLPPARRPAPPTRRQGLLRAEYETLKWRLRVYYRWLDGQHGEPPALRSGVARASTLGERVVGSKPGSRAPGQAADLAEADDAWLRRLHDVMVGLDPLEAALVRWKAAGPDDDDRPTIGVIAERLCLTERQAVDLWARLALFLTNHVWPGGSGGFARQGREGR
jgi:hypothetical protein